MDSLRHQTDLERKERARAAFRVTENIAQEREGIVTQVSSRGYDVTGSIPSQLFKYFAVQVF